MARIVITHAVKDVEHWLGGQAERAAAIPGGTVTDVVAMDGSNQAGVVLEVEDMDAFKGFMASMPPEVAAQAEAHGVIQPMTAYVEA